MSKADSEGITPSHGGGCLCGAIRYEIEGDLAPIQICHCEDCRKAQGSAFAAKHAGRDRAVPADRGGDATARL